jgi:hypothetical protein
MFIVWNEFRNIADLPYRYAIFAQHIDSSGARLWGDSGILVSNKFRDQGDPRIIGDTKGGSIISWYSNDTGHFACQRIDPNGNALWTKNGVFVADYHVRGAREFAPTHDLIPDGSGGAILVYESYLWPDSVNIATDIYAQRVDSNGIRLWPVDGKPVCTADSNQLRPNAIADGAGGAFVAWTDERNGSDNTDIYGTRIDGNGNTYPVELMSFSAAFASDHVALDWRTAMEMDNYGFEIERTAIGSGDAPPGTAPPGDAPPGDAPPGAVWNRVGFVAGHGNTDARQSYRYDDPLTAELERRAWLLYRLRQIDNDGSATYSPVARVRMPHAGACSLSDPFPNPCSSVTQLRCTLAEEARIELSVRDLLGRRIAAIAAGDYQAGGHAFSYDASALARGIYAVTFTAATGSGAPFQQTRLLSVLR